MPQLALYLLGPPRVELDGEPVHIGRRKAVALLAYLAVEGTGLRGRSHSRDALATLLWPEHDQSRARANLRDVLSTLNRSLGEGWLEADRDTVALSRVVSAEGGRDLWIDVDQFHQRLAACAAHGHPPRQPCSDCLPLLEEVVALYQGDFLAGFSLRDSLAFDEWQLFQAEELRQAQASALERLVRGLGAQKAYEAALPHARRWLALDPLHEQAHRQLMALYARAGQVSAALRQYEECKRIFEEELGGFPTEKTVELYLAIREGRGQPLAAEMRREPDDAARIELVDQPRDVRRDNIPVPFTAFVGRGKTLAEINERLSDPTCRLLTLAGPGGIGKTRLAIEVARQAAEEARRTPKPLRFSNGVFFVNLAPVANVDALVPAVAWALDFNFYGEGDPEKQLVDFLRGKEMLLVLDNFEHLLGPLTASQRSSEQGTSVERGGADLLVDILATAPKVKILVTSCEALNLQGEWYYPIDGLDYPVSDEVWAEAGMGSLEDYSAVALFVQGARRAAPSFSLATEAHAIVKICQLVEGMPLGIEMAAAWLKALPPSRIAQELERGLDILTTTLRDVPARMRSIRAVFDQSWRLLSDEERSVLEALSVFCGSFGTDAASAVAGVSLPILVGLVEKSLLRWTSAGRYEMHGLFRQYCAEKLSGDLQEEEGAHDRHSEYYADFLATRGEALKGHGQELALTELDVEIDNAREAWNWSVERRKVERLEQAVEGLCLFYQWRGRYKEGDAACRLAAEALDSEPRTLAKIWTWQAAFCRMLGRAEQARHLLDKSLALLEETARTGDDTRPEKAFALHEMGMIWSDLGENLRLNEQSLALYQEVGDRWATANLLAGVGWVLRGMGEYERAKQALEESLAIRRALGDKRGVGHSLQILRGIALRYWNADEAEELTHEVITIHQEIRDRAGLANGYMGLAWARNQQGRFTEAHELFEKAIEIYDDLGVRFDIIWAVTGLCAVQVSLGRYAEARAQGEAGIAMSQQAGVATMVARSLHLLGCVALAEGRYAEAQELAHESVAKYRPTGDHNIGFSIALAGYAALALGQLSTARDFVNEALQMALTAGDVFLLFWTLPATALLLAERGELEWAVEVYALVSRHPFAAKSRWFEDVVGRRMAAVAASLPPDVAAQAQKRGQARDVQRTAAELLEALREPGLADEGRRT